MGESREEAMSCHSGLGMPPEADHASRREASGTEGPLVKSLGLVEGEILAQVRVGGPTTLRGLMRALNWPARMVLMAVGALLHAGLVEAEERELEVVIRTAAQPCPAPEEAEGANERVPEVWGG